MQLVVVTEKKGSTNLLARRKCIGEPKLYSSRKHTLHHASIRTVFNLGSKRAAVTFLAQKQKNKPLWQSTFMQRPSGKLAG